MKKCIYSAFVILILLSIGCGHHIETIQSYLPPSLKNQPRLYYPKIAQENAYSGTPKLLLFISQSGMVDKVNILKSSGFSILDTAAVNYAKNFIFNPAERMGSPVYSRMIIDVKFVFADNKWNAENYVDEVKDLYDQLKIAGKDDKIELEREILDLHNDYAENMKDVINYNMYLKQVMLPDIKSEWEKYWNSWPLSFLIYYDFSKRFPDYNQSEVKESLKNSLRCDIQYIKATKDASTQKEREILLNKIRSFIAKNYPDFLDELGFDAETKIISVF